MKEKENLKIQAKRDEVTGEASLMAIYTNCVHVCTDRSMCMERYPCTCRHIHVSSDAQWDQRKSSREADLQENMLTPTSSKQILWLSSRLFSSSMRKAQGFSLGTREWKAMLGSGDTGMERGPQQFFLLLPRWFQGTPRSLIPCDVSDWHSDNPEDFVEFFVPSSLPVSVFHYFCQMLFCKSPHTPEVRMNWPSR